MSDERGASAVLNLDRVVDLLRGADTFAEAWRSPMGKGLTSVGYVRATGPNGAVAYGCGVYTGSRSEPSAFVDDFACCPGDLADDYDGDFETAENEIEAARVLARLVAATDA